MPGETISRPSTRSKVFKKCIFPIGASSKNQPEDGVNKTELLPDLLQNIFTGDEMSIKDHYAALVTYLVLNGKDVTYDKFTGSYESVNMNCQPKFSICSALPYGALVASGLIKIWQPEQQSQIFSKLFRISQKNAEFSNVMFHFMISFVNNIKTLNTPKLKKVSVKSFNELYLILAAESKCDDQLLESSGILESDNIGNLVNVYLEGSEDQKTYKEVSTLLAKKLLSLVDTFKVCWDHLSSSYEANKSRQKEVLSLNLIAALLANYNKTDPSLLIEIFNPLVIKLLTKSNLNKDPMMKSISLSMTNLSQSLNGEIKLSLVENIITKTPKIDNCNAAKLCDILISNMGFEEVSSVTDSYRKIILGEKMKEIQTSKKIEVDFSEFEKIHCVQCLAKLLCLNSCKNQLDWKKSQLKFLFKIGFLKNYQGVVTKHMAGCATKIFFHCLNKKFAKLCDYDKVLKKIVKFASEKIGEEIALLNPPTEKDIQLWNKTQGIIDGLNNDNDDNIIFRILLRYMMLYLLYDFQIAKNSLEELFKVVENKDAGGGGFHWTEVTVDLFLHLLSMTNNPHKNVINITFGHVCRYMTEGGLNLILSAVKGGSDESSDDESESDEMEADESDEGSDEDQSDESDLEDDGNYKENDLLKDALRQELFKIDTASTCGSVDLDEMDEEERKQLNASLGQIFKQQQATSKSSNKNKVDNLEIHFRIRALDLLEIYLNNNPSLYSATVILTTLMTLLKSAIPNYLLAPLAVSLKKCLKTLTNLKKFSNVDAVTETSICSVLNQILHRDCSAKVYQEITEQIVDSSLFLIKAALQLPETSGEIDNFLNDLLKTFFKSVESSIPFQTFTTIFSSLTLSKLINITPCLVKYAFSKKLKLHKRTQALQLLITFYNNNRIFKDIGNFKSQLDQIEKKILSKSLKIANKTRSNNSEMNKMYACMFLDLLCLLKSKNTNKTTDTDPDVYRDIITVISEIPLIKDGLKLSFLKFCQLLNFELENNKKPKKDQKRKKQKRTSLENNGNTVIKSPKRKKFNA